MHRRPSLSCQRRVRLREEKRGSNIHLLSGGWSRSLDSILFVIKHLLILREQTAPYRHAAQRYPFPLPSPPSSITPSSLRSDASLPTRDLSIDFSKMRSSASNLLYDRSKWFELSTNNAFLELLFQVW